MLAALFGFIAGGMVGGAAGWLLGAVAASSDHQGQDHHQGDTLAQDMAERDIAPAELRTHNVLPFVVIDGGKPDPFAPAPWHNRLTD